MSENKVIEGRSNRSAIYRIRVEGKLDKEWSAWLGDMVVELESETPPVTSLTGVVTDQAYLRGVLNRLWNLNRSLISVERMEDQLRNKP